jgi:hypothetical protein
VFTTARGFIYLWTKWSHLQVDRAKNDMQREAYRYLKSAIPPVERDERNRPLSHEQLDVAEATPDPRHAEQLLPNSASCGNQPAHISLTARRQRHAHHPDAATKHE